MTPEQLSRVEELYFRVRDLPGGERAAILAAACDDEAVIAEAESLLNTDAPEGFLATPLLDGVLASVAEDTPDGLIGKQVGPWRIERLIGSGGMGAVYLAARADGAFEGHAAIKVVKRGMDTDELLRRFRTERRTLANLNHPNIATMLDAGSLPDGRPYLVMEHVPGMPITAYCREHRLTTRSRLELFIAVCRAVQFAHQNLVVHRDLKPGNILVTAEGVPKLLDFGIAKVLTPGGSSVAVTGIDERRLTPEYASPEQVEGRAVTTAADIYSLGVILYELLTDRQPYHFETRTTAEIQRVVATASPPLPSVAAARSDTPAARLHRELRGDLDNIVLAAMRKESQRRYPSAERFAADIEACIRGFPITARRDTLPYRASKFVRRHRWGMVAVSAMALLLAVGAAAIVWQARIAGRQRDQAFIARDQSEAIAKFLQDMLAAGDPQREHAGITVREILDKAADDLGDRLGPQPLVESAVRSAIGSAYLGLGLHEQAERQIRAAYTRRLELVGPRHHDTAESMVDLASVLYARGEFPEAERLLREALDVFRNIRGEHNIDVARTLNNLGAVLRAEGKLDEAGQTLEIAIRMRRAISGGRTVDLAESLNNYAGVLRGQKRLDEARATLTESLAIRRALLRPDNPLVAQSLGNLAVLIAVQGDLDSAEPLFREAVQIEQRSLGPDHPECAVTLVSLANVLRKKGRAVEAEPLLREALRIREAALRPGDPRIAQTQAALADVLLHLNRLDEAKDVIDRAVRGTSGPGIDGSLRGAILEGAITIYETRGDAVGAEKLRRMRADQSAGPPP